MKTGLKRFLCSVLAVTTMIGMSAVAFASVDSSSEAEGSESSVSEAASEAESSTDEATAESSEAESTAETGAVESTAATTEAVSNPSTGVDSSMLPLSVMGVFLVLAGGVAAVTAKRKTSEQ